MDHYFSNLPEAQHERRTISVQARGITLELTTDSGVFSKRGLDYGTSALIEAVRLPEHGTIVDLGCGYGPVSGVLAQVYPSTNWVLLEINQRAAELARFNLRRFSSRVKIYESDGFSSVSNLQADAVLLNPPIRAGKQVVYRLFSEAYSHLSDNGELWIVIRKQQGALSAAKYLQALFETVVLRSKTGGYHVYRCVKGPAEGSDVHG